MRKNLAGYVVFGVTFGLLAAGMSTAAYAVPAGSTGYANCSDAINIRSAAGPDSTVIGTLYNNDEVYVESVDDLGWALIYANGVEGYVAGQYLSSAPNSNTSGSGTSASSTDTGAGSSSNVDALYQAYLAAEDAAMHPSSEEEAQTTAAAAVEAYNAYLKAVNAYDEAVANGTAVSEDNVPVVDDSSSQSTETGTSQSGAATGSAIAQYATQFVGNPYVYGGSSLTGGADCSGFVMAVFAHFGISLPHNAAAQSGYGSSISMSDLQPGDLLFYSNGGGIGHVTIYIGNNQVCHASNSKVGIVISSINYRTPCAARRLV
jgi:cell wall-associated NlpC family hydrolase